MALPLTAVVHLHASPVQMGLLGAVAWMPHLVLGLPAGVWVDRMPYKWTLVASDLVQTLLLGSIPVLATLGLLQIWQLYVVALLAGIGNLFETVTAQSFIPILVSRRQLLPANSAFMLSNATGSALGACWLRCSPRRSPSPPTRSRFCSPGCARHGDPLHRSGRGLE